VRITHSKFLIHDKKGKSEWERDSHLALEPPISTEGDFPEILNSGRSHDACFYGLERVDEDVNSNSSDTSCNAML